MYILKSQGVLMGRCQYNICLPEQRLLHRNAKQSTMCVFALMEKQETFIPMSAAMIGEPESTLPSLPEQISKMSWGNNAAEMFKMWFTID